MQELHAKQEAVVVFEEVVYESQKAYVMPKFQKGGVVQEAYVMPKAMPVQRQARAVTVQRQTAAVAAPFVLQAPALPTYLPPPRTGISSSLSPPRHSLVAARIQWPALTKRRRREHTCARSPAWHQWATKDLAGQHKNHIAAAAAGLLQLIYGFILLVYYMLKVIAGGPRTGEAQQAR